MTTFLESHLVRDLQYDENLGMPQSRPMPSIRQGVHELRVADFEKSVRVFYFLKLKDKILIFHIFIKKSQKTPKKELDKAAARLRQLLKEVQSGK